MISENKYNLQYLVTLHYHIQIQYPANKHANKIILKNYEN